MRDTTIEVACDEPLVDDIDSNSLFAVIKITSDVTHKRYTKALDILIKASGDISHAAHPLIQILLRNSPAPFIEPFSLEPNIQPLLYQLNVGQKEAVCNALRAKHLAVIHGPPGTGKTYTLTALIQAEVMRGARVLVVAPSNVAVDNIAERLANVKRPPRFVRAGHPARIISSIAEYGLAAQVLKTDESRLAQDIRGELDELEAKIGKSREKCARKTLRVQQRQLRKELRKRENAAVERLLSRMDVVLSTISGAGAHVLDIAERAVPFDVVVIDEAAQALEAACWVALLRGKKAVLAGDPHQLSGTVKSVEAERRGLKKCILSRILDTPTLKNTITMLKIQYRMNTVISTWSSQEFYKSKLVADSSVANHRVVDLDGCEEDADDHDILTQPFILIDTAGGDCEEDVLAEDAKKENESLLCGNLGAHASRSNKGEAQIMCNVVRRFVSSGISVRDIAVISPYSGQVELLRQLLWPEHDRSLEVATIDSFQGREKEVVCMSLVRSNESGKIGFLKDQSRLNVAITRARRCVVIICDSETISTDPFLERIVLYAEKFGSYRSAVVDFPDIVGTFSQSRRPVEAINAERSTLDSQRSRSIPKKFLTKPRSNLERPKKPLHFVASTVAENNAVLSEAVLPGIESEIRAFMSDEDLKEKTFSSDLSARERRIIHELAEKLNICHGSIDVGRKRQIKIWKLYEDASHTDLQSSDSEAEYGVDANPYEYRKIQFELLNETVDITDSQLSDDKEAGQVEVLNSFDKKLDEKSGEPSPKEGHAPSSDYHAMNDMLREAGKAREKRKEDSKTEASKNSPTSSLGTVKEKRKGRRKKNARGKKDSEEDFDTILAEYGCQQSAASSSVSGLSGPVAQIVNGRITRNVTSSKNTTRARKKLAEKLSEEAEKRKRKTKK